MSMIRLSTFLVLAVSAVSTAAQGVAPADLSRQRPAILEGFRVAERGALSVQDVARIADHPLLAWVEATAMRRQLAHATAREVRAVLARHDGQPAADWLRDAWLMELAKRGEW
ncbi:MAG: hypothetical protein K0M70_15770, partial [Arenimonas sp.]|uniref:hypothetical protein n=1 Tax=Arenimonas sp. TaxID=1872635 RepID=UPI0025BA89B5